MILDALALFRKSRAFENQEETLNRFQQFIKAHDDCFERSCKEGHLTGSALILSPDHRAVLLTHHAKLDRWMQLGGHADGHSLLHEVALREAQEESGIGSFIFLPWYEDSTIPFDIDIHEIPACQDVQAHLHYDVRYLLMAKTTDLVISEESHDLRWVLLDEVQLYTQEESVLRQIRKARVLASKVEPNYDSPF